MKIAALYLFVSITIHTVMSASLDVQNGVNPVSKYRPPNPFEALTGPWQIGELRVSWSQMISSAEYLVTSFNAAIDQVPALTPMFVRQVQAWLQAAGVPTEVIEAVSAEINNAAIQLDESRTFSTQSFNQIIVTMQTFEQNGTAVNWEQLFSIANRSLTAINDLQNHMLDGFAHIVYRKLEAEKAVGLLSGPHGVFIYGSVINAVDILKNLSTHLQNLNNQAAYHIIHNFAFVQSNGTFSLAEYFASVGDVMGDASRGIDQAQVSANHLISQFLKALNPSKAVIASVNELVSMINSAIDRVQVYSLLYVDN